MILEPSEEYLLLIGRVNYWYNQTIIYQHSDSEKFRYASAKWKQYREDLLRFQKSNDQKAYYDIEGVQNVR